MTEESQQTLNIPSLIAFTALTIFAIRYFFFSSSSSSSSSGSSAQRGYRVPSDRIDTLASMFPQYSRRDIEWDLRRNGANVQATTDRILRDGRIPTAPQNFRAQTPPPSANPSNSQGTSEQGQGRRENKSQYQNLIQRYSLASKLGASGDVADGEDVIQTREKQKEKGAWSSSKNDRADILKKRREEMVLAARRKMELKERKEGKAKAT